MRYLEPHRRWPPFIFHGAFGAPVIWSSVAESTPERLYRAKYFAQLKRTPSLRWVKFQLFGVPHSQKLTTQTSITAKLTTSAPSSPSIFTQMLQPETWYQINWGTHKIQSEHQVFAGEGHSWNTGERE